MVNKGVGLVVNGVKDLYRAYIVLLIGLAVTRVTMLSIQYLLKLSVYQIGPGYVELVDFYKKLTAIIMWIMAPLVITGMVSLYYHYHGFSYLKEYSGRYRIGFNGSKIAIISLIITLTTVALIPLPFTEAVKELNWDVSQLRRTLYGVFIFSLTILAIGSLMVFIGLWRLSNKYHCILIKIGIPLLIIGVLIPITDFIGIILVVLGLKSILKELSVRVRIPPPPPPPAILEE